MKPGRFTLIVLVIALVVSILVWWFVFGAVTNFKDGAARKDPVNLIGRIFTGGYLVPLLLCLSIMVITFIFERIFFLGKAQGKGSVVDFVGKVHASLNAGKIDEALSTCDTEKGSCASIMRAGLERYKKVAATNAGPEKIAAETQRAIDEATMLEVPLMEQNLTALSTIASIATMVGLLGTVIGMIRAFQALAHAGAPDAIQLAVGISEALVNTAGGLLVAITGIVAYNYFVTRIDNFTYSIDEATYSVVRSLTGQEK